MSASLQNEMNLLQKEAHYLCDLVEKNFNLVYKTVMSHSDSLAKKVIEAEEKIDLGDIQVEARCMKILALYQPYAKDLRYLIAMTKIHTLLERTGDIISNIAAFVLDLNQPSKVLGKSNIDSLKISLQELFDRIQTMIQFTIESLKKLDVFIIVKAIKQVKYIKKAHADFCLQVAQSLKNYSKKPKDASFTTFQVAAHIAYWKISQQLDRISDEVDGIARNVLHIIN